MINKKIVPIITIDGPSGSGKGVLSKSLSKVLNWNLLDSGMIYRALAAVALEKRININDEIMLAMLADSITVDFSNKSNQIFIFFLGKLIRLNIRTEIIGDVASKIAVFPKVRKILLKYQRKFCVFPGLVADGRDMGTVVFPQAVLKIFLYASTQERKRRRLLQLQKNDSCANNSMKDYSIFTIIERDNRDYCRKLAPLVPAVDALILDSTHLSETEVQKTVFMYINKNLVLPIKKIM